MKKHKGFILLLIALSFCLSSCGFFNQYKEYDDKSIQYIVDDLINKINQSEYGYVEDYIDYLVDKQISSYNGTRLLEELYDTVGRKRDIQESLDAWCSKEDAHYSAFVFRGWFMVHHAWRARGSGVARTISDKGWEGFYERLKHAREDLEKAYAMNPSDPNSASAMITVCMGLREDEHTMDAWFQKAMDADPVSFFPYLCKFTFLDPKWRGTHAKQDQFVRHCLQDSPKNSTAYTIMVHYIEEMASKSKNQSSFYHNPKIKEIVSPIFQKWLDAFPMSVRARHFRAKMNYYLDHKREAIDDCTNALLIEPTNAEILRLRAKLYWLHKTPDSYEKAEKDLLKAAEYDHENNSIYALLGRFYETVQKDYPKAEKYITKAIQLDPTQKGYYFDLSMIRIHMKKYKEALESLNKVIEMDPDYARAYAYRNQCYRQLGNLEEAQKNEEIADGLFERKRRVKMLSVLQSSGATQYIKSRNNLNMDFFEELPLWLANLLSQHHGTLSLNGLQELTPEIAVCLGKLSGELHLEGIEVLSGDAAACLCRTKKNRLFLGLREVTPEVAVSLGRGAKMLYLPNVTTLSPEAAEKLSKKVSYLHLDGLKTLTPEVAEALGNVRRQLHLNGLEELSPDSAAYLVGVEDCVVLNGLKTLSKETAERLSHAKGGLILDGLETLPLETTRVLATHQASLSLNGLETLPPETARLLAQHQGSLSLGGVASLTPEAEDYLTRHEGSVYVKGKKLVTMKEE